ncbi:MAG TPA: hemerythrin domain-containing protein [Pusillimonas sp.]|uniref:hemerythrin domain-containing protein n=1 Tax=unclassified Pusillimonas TaxID=2640016 RepID=UPI00260E1D07|nr:MULTISPECIES: hemerythrin domain-containing protein [unclassified Pusillimonas]HLU19171.1 hemerythrin domain-containing protein [Pusillimonas sp.]
MDLNRFKAEHDEIINGINDLRNLSHAGVVGNAAEIAQRLTELNAVVTRHLAVEDRILYPAVQNSPNPGLANMGKAYQEEMTGIANAYIAFGRRWSAIASLQDDPEGFRQAANTVLRMVYERLQKENREFYPAVELM